MSLPPLQLSQEDHASLNRKLCYARWLYKKGEEQMAVDSELSNMMAITHFFNSIEILVQAILVYRNWMTAAERNGLTFDGFIDKLDKKGTKERIPPEVPRRQQVMSLKAKRNDIVHHGHRFHTDEVEESRKTCRLFLKEAGQLFLGIDPEQASMADLVRGLWPREKLREAHNKLDVGDSKGALAALAVVFNLVEDRLGSIIGRAPGIRRIQGSGTRRSKKLRKLNRGRSAHPLASDLDELRDAHCETERIVSEQARDVGNLVQLTKRGMILSLLDTAGALNFFKVAPPVVAFFDDSGRLQHDIRWYSNFHVEQADLASGFEFVCDSVLRAESILRAPLEPDEQKFWTK